MTYPSSLPFPSATISKTEIQTTISTDFDANSRNRKIKQQVKLYSINWVLTNEIEAEVLEQWLDEEGRGGVDYITIKVKNSSGVVDKIVRQVEPLTIEKGDGAINCSVTMQEQMIDRLDGYQIYRDLPLIEDLLARLISVIDLIVIQRRRL